MNLTMQEKKVILVLKEKDKQNISDISKTAKLPEAAVMRAVAWLQEKQLCTVKEENTEKLELDEEGVNYATNGLPERLILREISKEKKTLKKLSEKIGEDKVKIGLVWLRKLNLGMIVSGEIQITPDGKKYLEEETEHEKILSLIKHGKKIPAEMNESLETLKKRGKIIKVIEKTERTIELTGKAFDVKDLKIEEEISSITAEMIKNKSWKQKKIRVYDVKAPVPIAIPGKKQVYLEFLDEVREKMIAMGFKEMRGNIIQTEFWNFDCLFHPQTHPTRTERDTYYLKIPKQGNLTDDELIEKVKKSHEENRKYKWDIEKARNLIMRSHTTCLSAKQLFVDKKYPLRYFSIGRNFRHDVIDATHLPEFHQMEGIVADESLTLRDLLGLLESFAVEIAGTKEIKFKCGYFPYTEPSVELFAKHPSVGWFELGGAGMFRPEMLEPLGVKVPVIAWGLGIERLAMLSLGFKHIKDLYSQDLKFLQEKA